jgi:fluoride exporter
LFRLADCEISYINFYFIPLKNLFYTIFIETNEKFLLRNIIVFFGAGFGGVFRYWLASFVQKYFPPYFPYGTLTVNLIGSFILGFMIFGFDEKELINSNVKLFIGIGFCGGFTTFSTFSFETFNLIRDTEFLFAGLNILANVFLTLLGVYIAYIITR